MKRTLILLLMLAGLGAAMAQADVDVNIGLPVIRVGPDPVMAVVPGTYVYFVVDLDGDLFFYQGYWWRFHNNRWYRAAAAAGPWKHFKAVPHPLLNLPPGWRQMPPGHAKLKFTEVKKNWKQWEKEKRWDKKATVGPEATPKPPQGKPENKGGHKPKGRR